jgi:hypothetical protein
MIPLKQMKPEGCQRSLSQVVLLPYNNGKGWDWGFKTMKPEGCQWSLSQVVLLPYNNGKGWGWVFKTIRMQV